MLPGKSRRWGSAAQLLITYLVPFTAWDGRYDEVSCFAVQQVFGTVQVQELYEITPGLPWSAHERPESRLVFIGRRLNAAELRAALEGCTTAS